MMYFLNFLLPVIAGYFPADQVFSQGVAADMFNSLLALLIVLVATEISTGEREKRITTLL